MADFIHKTLAAGGWRKLSLCEQLGNIGSEISRADLWQKKDMAIFQRTVDRALELFDLTLSDPRWRGRRREIARAREVFSDAVLGGREYGSSLKELVPYFNQFAVAAQLQKRL
jgi:hypothetical protein